MPWADRVESLLYDGESCKRRFELGSESGSKAGSASTTLVVTSHRVLAFTPESDGADFRQIDRPNVGSVTITTTGQSTHCWRAIKYGLVGVGLLVLSAAVTLESLLPSLESAGVDSSTPGMEGVTGAVTQVERVLSVLDALILIGGAAVTVTALAFAGLYLRSRRRQLVLEVAGGDDVEVPIDGGEPAITDLERAIRPDPVDGMLSAALEV